MPVEIAYKFRRQKRALFFKRAFFLLVFFLIIGVTSLYFLNKTLQVREVRVLGASGSLSEEIEQEARLFFGKNFYFFLNKSAVLWNSDVLESQLLASFPSLSLANVRRNLSEKTAFIEIKEREPWAVWCGDSCFYIDATGVLFGRSPDFSGDLVLKMKDSRSLNIKLGERIEQESALENLRNFIGIFEEARGEKILTIEINEGPEFLLRLEKFALKFDYQANPARALENFNILINSVPEKELESIDYIDLRFEDKIFYR